MNELWLLRADVYVYSFGAQLAALAHLRQIFLSPGTDTRMRKRVKKKFVFVFFSFNKITIPIHNTCQDAHRIHQPYTIYCIYNDESFSILNSHTWLAYLKSKNCLHVKRRSFHFNFFSPFCRQSSALNEWYDDVIIQTTVPYSLFSSMFVLILNSLILRTTSVTRSAHAFNVHIFMVSFLHLIF